MYFSLGGGLVTNHYCLQADSSVRSQVALMTAYAITIHDIVLTGMEQQLCSKPRIRRKKKSQYLVREKLVDTPR